MCDWSSDVCSSDLVDVLAGARELTLLGQNVNSYGQDLSGHGEAASFARLLEAVAGIAGLARLRFTTSHPKDIHPEVVRAFARHTVLCPHLHLPLQSGSDRVLDAMRRGYDTGRYLRIVEDLRRARPDIALGTDLMVGFPGEDEADFERTLGLMRAAGFEASYSFIHSDRPGTRAERMQPKVPAEVAAERLLRLQGLQDELTGVALAAQVGRIVEVLAEGPSRMQEPGAPLSWRGHDAHGRVVNFRIPEALAGPDAPEGRFVRVRVTEAKKHSLRGEAVKRPW
jgi:tRNA-2-methylthio-N6-dimethylallyladenosine synthase